MKFTNLLDTLKIKYIIIGIFTILLIFSCNEKISESSEPIQNTDIAYSYQDKADEYFAQSKLDSAYSFYIQSNTLLASIPDTLNHVYNTLKIAELHLVNGDPNSAQEITTEILAKYPIRDTLYLAQAYNLLGISYRENLDYDHAIANYTKTLQLISDSISTITLQNNIASLYLHKKEPEKAIQILETLIEYPLLSANPNLQALVINNLGFAHFLINEDQGLPEMTEALQIRKTNNLNNQLTSSYKNLSKYYYKKNSDKSKYYAKQAYEISRKLNNKQDQLISLELMIKSTPLTSLDTLSESYINLSNSFYNERQLAKNQFAKIRFDHQKETEENLLLKSENQNKALALSRQKNIILLLVFSGITTLILAYLGYIYLRKKSRIEKARQAYLTETHISKKIHDELANDIFNIMTYCENFDLEKEDSKNRLLFDLEKSYATARNISLEHNSINTDTNFIDSIKSLLKEYNSTDTKIITIGTENPFLNKLSQIQKQTIYRIIQELLVNMKKHSMASVVVFKFEETKREVSIFYSDNGVGILLEPLVAKNGLQNVETRIHNIGGSISFDSESRKGLQISIKFPKAYV